MSRFPMTPRCEYSQRSIFICGKNAVVSGETSGIGRAMVEMLLRDGALAQMESLGEVSGLPADQSKIEDVQRVFREADARALAASIF